jgi:hypothetical protein
MAPDVVNGILLKGRMAIDLRSVRSIIYKDNGEINFYYKDLGTDSARGVIPFGENEGGEEYFEKLVKAWRLLQLPEPIGWKND